MVVEWVAKERAITNKFSIFFLGLGILLLSIGIYMLMTNDKVGLIVFLMGASMILISIKKLYTWNRPRKPKNEYTLSDTKLIKFMKPYHQITIEAIAEHFFPLAGVKFAAHPDIVHVLQAKRVVEKALEKLISTQQISGCIRTLDGVRYYIGQFQK